MTAFLYLSKGMQIRRKAEKRSRRSDQVVEMEHPVAGNTKITGNQIKLSETPVHYERPTPLLGQHTAEILKEFLGLDETAVQELAEKKVV